MTATPILEYASYTLLSYDNYYFDFLDGSEYSGGGEQEIGLLPGYVLKKGNSITANYPLCNM
jgi:hypothetical protein